MIEVLLSLLAVYWLGFHAGKLSATPMPKGWLRD